MRLLPGEGFDWIETAGGPALVCRPLERFAAHLFTTRAWALGSPNGKGHDAAGTAAWAAVAAAMGVAPGHLARVHQVHGADVVVRSATGESIASSAANSLPEADIILSADPSQAIAIQTADCVPMLLADSRSGAVAAAHAGWRGLAAGVPGVTVRAMADAFGSRAADLVVAVGPSISAAQYEVGEDVRARFASSHPAESVGAWFGRETRPGHWLFDGWTSAGDQLVQAGVRRTSIFNARSCTAQYPDLFCSFRRDGRGAGRMAAAIRAKRDR
jgi:polyphenol oxidase